MRPGQAQRLSSAATHGQCGRGPVTAHPGATWGHGPLSSDSEGHAAPSTDNMAGPVPARGESTVVCPHLTQEPPRARGWGGGPRQSHKARNRQAGLQALSTAALPLAGKLTPVSRYLGTWRVNLCVSALIKSPPPGCAVFHLDVIGKGTICFCRFSNLTARDI